MKGVFLGTPGGAEPPFTPMVTAFTPSDVRMGIALRVNPGTSRCAQQIVEKFRNDVSEQHLLVSLEHMCTYCRIRTRRDCELQLLGIMGCSMAHLAQCELRQVPKCFVKAVSHLDGRADERLIHHFQLAIEGECMPIYDTLPDGILYPLHSTHVLLTFQLAVYFNFWNY